MSDLIDPNDPRGQSSIARGITAVAGLFGAVSFIAALVALQPYQLHVVRYETVSDPSGRYLPASVFAGFLIVGLIVLAWWSARAQRTPGAYVRFALALAPLSLAAPTAVYILLDRPPPFGWSYLIILGAGWAAYRAALLLPSFNARAWVHGWAVVTLLVLIVALTVIHTRIQINLFDHFMLGHADFGHFTEELKNALAGRGLRSDSFPHTRLGWHFVPLLYLLVPGYALWPSPVYLMVCSALFVHLPALPIYFLARWRSGSVLVGWLFALAWLLLPSQSRQVYSNTYGFQWVYVAMPLIVVMLSAGIAERWRTSLVITAVCLLCKETIAAATFGWGVCLAIFTRRRSTGAAIAVGSLFYVTLCVSVFIPYFADGGGYQRMTLFGELGHSFTELLQAPFTQPELFFDRLTRQEGFHFVAMLLVSMGCLPLVGWRVALAVVPSLILLLLLDNAQWLSIKFWHQATILPVLFVAGVTALLPSGDPDRASDWLGGKRARTDASRARRNLGFALAAISCAAWSHYFYGFSPISKRFGPYANNAALHEPDPRLEVVQQLRVAFPRTKTVLATERLAAHFTDYRRIYTGGRVEPVDLIVIDRNDRWDMSGLVERAGEFASNPDYRLYGEFDGIVVIERRPDAPPVE